MRIQRVRYLVQIIFLFLLLYGGYLGLRFNNFLPFWSCPNSLDHASACYLLPLQRFQYGIDTYLKHPLPFPAYFIIQGWKAYLKFFLSLFIFIIVFNKVWCGWVCPFGTLQDGISFIRKKLGLEEIYFPEKTKHILKPIKYISLLIFMNAPFLFAFGFKLDWPLFCKICPVKSILPFSYGNTLNISVGFPPGTLFSILTCIITGFIIVALFFRERFFCILCPVSALFNFFQRISFLQLKKNIGTCNNCGNCWRVCPLDIKEVYLERKNANIIKDDCILCLKCIEACPQEGALAIKFFNKTIFTLHKRPNKVIKKSCLGGEGG